MIQLGEQAELYGRAQKTWGEGSVGTGDVGWSSLSDYPNGNVRSETEVEEVEDRTRNASAWTQLRRARCPYEQGKLAPHSPVTSSAKARLSNY